ncbi:hypothetical protein LTR56_014446 [Elasticomyces elasticus]|nr:hypothetical protein LTR56_014446 [Elasticomyces elasticus]KAK3646504.1 hypothetical protein LTR22_014267 [Elasticomyces elasticus]KAK4908579.1 hypothetical protein LTR49_022537 [Elasticomyces elasticus]KAK5755685.1 hypothetical protein LTS12_014246 [Elasticomyces elasticus]
MDLVRLPICRHCLSALRRSAKPNAKATSPTILRRFISAKTHNERLRATPTQPRKQSVQVLESLLVAARSAHTVSSQDLNALHTRVLELSSISTEQTGQPVEEQRVLYILEQFQALAADLISGPGLHPKSETSPSPQNQDDDKTATSALLGSVNARPYPSFISQASLLHTISERAEALLRHPDVFITPQILKSYVSLQTLLHQPSSLPDIFDLYARKPIPTTSPTGKTTYSTPSPSKINSAIPSPTAQLALESAIAAHDLSLALDIITTSFCAPAYTRAKILRQAMIPLSGLVILPLAAYTLSSQYAAFFQSSMSPGYATGVAFTGIMAYVVHVSTIGYVAITTSNDQMDRVTWAQGVPLWERWIREEERAAIDKVAGKWGFEGREQRGEEEGEEWGVLREWVGRRGMELDRRELMEGME